MGKVVGEPTARGWRGVGFSFAAVAKVNQARACLRVAIILEEAGHQWGIRPRQVRNQARGEGFKCLITG